MDEINVPHLIVYFDAYLQAIDGNGWCIDPIPGSTTYRFPTFEHLAKAMSTWTMYEFLKHPTLMS
jgi:hypothetical protein